MSRARCIRVVGDLAGDALLCLGWHAMRAVTPLALGAAGTVLGLAIFAADEIRAWRGGQ